MRRPAAVCAVALVLASAGCAGLTYSSEDVSRIFTPQNDGANAGAKGVYVRNSFLLGASLTGRSETPAAGLPLYAVLINERAQPVRLERITLAKGGQVQLAGPVEVPPGGIVGTDRPIGTVTGVADTGSVPMTFSFTAGPNDMRLIVPVVARTGVFASLNPSGAPANPSGAPANPSGAPANPSGAPSPGGSPAPSGSAPNATVSPSPTATP
ncbi:hypothetical protein [Nonomuraea rhodomycinica]|uniref:Copper(I)-binding protein n=1 Tax=Nonomuraea rhodomycinica TaxID=1712872 RepID=A0A7Y6MAY4_9ACTN|nr:hypothetical protein [Nonomuraea rhodomycinica]NUW41703.1 hypothetical protein [Nonomuraea rhodomycinica]